MQAGKTTKSRLASIETEYLALPPPPFRGGEGHVMAEGKCDENENDIDQQKKKEKTRQEAPP